MLSFLLILLISALGLAMVLLPAWMALAEPRRFRVWEFSLPRSTNADAEGLSVPADSFPELDVLHITDTHFNGRDVRKLGFLRTVFERIGEPDFVFITGDILDSPPGLGSCFELADMTKARLGAYAVLGKHDYFRSSELWRKYVSIHRNVPPQPRRRKSNPVEPLRHGMSERGVAVLEDENRRVHLPDGGRLAVIGLSDAFFYDCDYEKAWAGAEGLASIVIAHSPDVLPEISRRGAHLAFFGHTHGGQVRLPLKGAVVTRSKLAPHRARGVFREGPTVFTINHGLGATRGTNIRLLCPPEVTLMHIGGTQFAERYCRNAKIGSRG